MELALHNFFEDDLVLGYWSGKDLITNGTKDDLEICKELAQKTKKDFKFFDVSFSFEECLSSLTKEELSKFGEYACIYAHNKKWLDLFDKIEGFDSVGFGSLNEIIRETPQIDEIEENQLTIKDLITKVKMRSKILKKVINYDELSNYILIQMKKKFNLTGETVSKDIGVNLFNENRLSANTIVDSYSNLYYYDFNICGQKNIVDLIESMPYKWRQQSKLILALTKEWNENLLEVPYFSHHTKVIYNKKLGTIELSQFNKIKRKIKKILENSIFYNGSLSNSVGRKNK